MTQDRIAVLRPDEESGPDRVRRLQAEAAEAARGIADKALLDAQGTALALADAADYVSLAPGIRDRMRRLAQIMSAELAGIEALKLRIR